MDIEIVKIHRGADNLIVDTYDECILANIMLEFDVNNKDKDDFLLYMEKYFVNNIHLDFKLWKESIKLVRG